MVSLYQPPIGAEVTAIDTPALLLNYGRLTANIDRMAAFVATTQVKLRPHCKTHKCVEIARLQLDAGATGITCATLGEAEALANGDVGDILIANQIVGPIKIARLVRLAGRCVVAVAVDDLENVRQLSLAAVSAGVTIRCYVEVNIMNRCGVEAGEPALELARLVATRDGLVFAGIQAYEGHLQKIMPFSEREARVQREMRGALEARDLIEAAGLPVDEVSGGGTGTSSITARLPWMTELQAGSYATMDARYASVSGVEFQNALTVLATVVSRPKSDTAVVDAGLKAVTPEHGDPVVLIDGATWERFMEEHGVLLLTGEARHLRVGDKIELVPGHGCTTINLHDRFHVMKDGHLVALWSVAAHGYSQ